MSLSSSFTISEKLALSASFRQFRLPFPFLVFLLHSLPKDSATAYEAFLVFSNCSVLPGSSRGCALVHPPPYPSLRPQSEGGVHSTKVDRLRNL